MSGNQLDSIQTPPVVISGFVYIRHLGDHSISERDFGTMQRNRMKEMARWADKLKEVEKYERHVKTAVAETIIMRDLDLQPPTRLVGN